jgi:predicted small lipoprotein YifL
MVDRIRRMKLLSSVASRPVRRAARLAALVTGLGMVVACGQKGPLTLPTQAPAAASAPGSK